MSGVVRGGDLSCKKTREKENYKNAPVLRLWSVAAAVAAAITIRSG